MVFLDTAFFIAVCHPRDDYHERAKLWVQQLKGTFLTTEYVLWEVANFFSQQINRPMGIEIIQTVRRTPMFRVVASSSELFDRGMAEYERAMDKAWSLTDCISFCIMREHAIARALTSDHHFDQAGFEALLLVDPLDP